MKTQNPHQALESCVWWGFWSFWWIIQVNNNLEKIDSLEKENKSLKNEIKGIYKGFKEYFKDSKQVTTEQVKTLVSGVLDKVKEFVKGGEFEKIHRNETQTRDRDELSR